MHRKARYIFWAPTNFVSEWGRAEVRVAFNDRAERYHSRNLVTERDATGELALLGGECGAPKSKPRFHLFTKKAGPPK